MIRHIGLALSLVVLAHGCGAAATPAPAAPLGPRSMQEEADAFLSFYDPILVALYTESAYAAWRSSTNVSEANTAARAAAETSFSAFAGNADVIRRARRLLEHQAELDDLTVRQLRAMLELAASAPMTDPDLARARIRAEAAQSARLDGFEFCLQRVDGVCHELVTTNDIDRALVTSDDLDARRRAWEASKEVGGALREGIVELRDLRNRVAREMGYQDFFSFQVANYGMSTDEMMALLDGLLAEIRPLYDALHCWARHRLAARYGVEEVPARIPAHWIGNRWSQSWPGLVEGVEMDGLVEDRSSEWIVRQAERFYVSMGFEELPETFWERSDLYPVPDDEDRRKNNHASAWHIDLTHDVRSLMSVEPTWSWFTTTHHELGHVYYFLAYARPEVPPLLREGANRSYHEGMGDLIALASSQRPYLREIGLLREGQDIDEVAWLLDAALTGPIVFLPWSAGVMSHFEKELYADELPAEALNERWWSLVEEHQGVIPPGPRPADGCDGCTKTHINDDPAQYYDYALANILVYQLHDHICRRLLDEDPRSCNYYGRREVGDFLRAIMALGATRDWREVLREQTGRDLTAEPMLEFFAPLARFLERENEGRACGR